MATRGIDEYAGTASGDVAGIADASGVVDPATLGTPVGSGDSDDGADYVRNADGSIKRNRDGSPRKKRGRKAGTGNARAPKSKDDLKSSVDALTNMIAISHVMLAAVAKAPEIALDETEANKLAAAAIPVLDLMDFAPDPRFVAIFGLLAVAGEIYIPRAYLIAARRDVERRKAADAKMKNVTPGFAGVDMGNA